MKAKKIIIPNELQIKEQALALTELDAKKHGFKKNSKKWRKTFDGHVGGYLISSIPEAMSNPRSPILPISIFTKFSKIFQNFTYSNDKKIADQIFKGAITSLTQLYVENVLGLKTKQSGGDVSDFEIPNLEGLSKEKKEDILKNIELHRYARYFIALSVLNSIEQVFTIKPDNINEIFIKLGLTEKSYKLLNKKETRDSFITKVYNGLKNIIQINKAS